MKKTGDLFQLTGRACIRWQQDTAVRVEVEEAHETPGGGALRFELAEPPSVDP